MVFPTGNSEYMVTRHSFDKVCVLWEVVLIRDFEGGWEEEAQSEVSRCLFSHEVQEMGLQRKNIKESGKLTEYR